jgi:hypothetical protein
MGCAKIKKWCCKNEKFVFLNYNFFSKKIENFYFLNIFRKIIFDKFQIHPTPLIFDVLSEFGVKIDQ